MAERVVAERMIRDLHAARVGGDLAGLYDGSWAEWGGREDCPVTSEASPSTHEV